MYCRTLSWYLNDLGCLSLGRSLRLLATYRVFLRFADYKFIMTRFYIDDQCIYIYRSKRCGANYSWNCRRRKEETKGTRRIALSIGSQKL